MMSRSHPCSVGILSASSWGLLVGLLLFLCTVHAVDPLPLGMENATPEAKARYMEEQAEESRREKLRVGRELYRARAKVRSDIHRHMAGEVANREKRLAGAVASISPGFRAGELLKSGGTLLFALLGLVVVYRVYRGKVSLE